MTKAIQIGKIADKVYAPVTGEGTSGTWPITAGFSNAANLPWVSAAIASSSSQNDTTYSLKVRSSGSLAGGDNDVAAISFQCGTSYTTKIHLSSSGYIGFGGGSSTPWRWYSSPNGDMVAAGNVTAMSDPRLKRDFRQISKPLEIINKLQGGTFYWKDGYTHTSNKAGNRDYGLLADQVHAVMPEIVSSTIELDGNQYMTVAYEKMIPVLLEAIKELESRILALEGK